MTRVFIVVEKDAHTAAGKQSFFVIVVFRFQRRGFGAAVQATQHYGITGIVVQEAHQHFVFQFGEEGCAAAAAGVEGADAGPYAVVSRVYRRYL